MQRPQPLEAALERRAAVLDERHRLVLLAQPAQALADLVLLGLLGEVEAVADVGEQAGLAELLDHGLDGRRVAHQLVAQQGGEAGVARQEGEHDHGDVAVELGAEVVDQERHGLAGAPAEQHAAVVTGVVVDALQRGGGQRADADPGAVERGDADDAPCVAHHHDVQLVAVAAGAEVAPPGVRPGPGEEDVGIGIDRGQVGPLAAQLGEPLVVVDDVEREVGHGASDRSAVVGPAVAVSGTAGVGEPEDATGPTPGVIAYSRSLSAEVTNQLAGSSTRGDTASSVQCTMKRTGSSVPRSRRTNPAARSRRSAGSLRVLTDRATAPCRRAAPPAATSSGAPQRGAGRESTMKAGGAAGPAGG